MRLTLSSFNAKTDDPPIVALHEVVRSHTPIRGICNLLAGLQGRGSSSGNHARNLRDGQPRLLGQPCGGFAVPLEPSVEFHMPDLASEAISWDALCLTGTEASSAFAREAVFLWS